MQANSLINMFIYIYTVRTYSKTVVESSVAGFIDARKNAKNSGPVSDMDESSPNVQTFFVTLLNFIYSFHYDNAVQFSVVSMNFWPSSWAIL